MRPEGIAYVKGCAAWTHEDRIKGHVAIRVFRVRLEPALGRTGDTFLLMERYRLPGTYAA
jgi:hypothetical protein